MCRGIWKTRGGTSMYGCGYLSEAKERGIYPTQDLRERGAKLVKKIDEILENNVSETEQESKEEKFYWQQKGNNSVSFYLPFGKKWCKGIGSKFCIEHCYLKTIPLEKEAKSTIQKTNMEDYDWETLSVLISKMDVEYITLFSSGCLEKLNDWKVNIVRIAFDNPNKYFRFFIREWHSYIPKLPENATIIFSIDYTSFEDNKILLKAMKSKSIKGIAIINHKINEELINWVIDQSELYGIDKIIRCEECISDGDDCSDDMMCFEQKEKFVLIQNFK